MTMDAKYVLKNFIDRCNDRADYLQYSLSSNSVLEWFGRTLRGNKKIEQYFRYDIWPQYEQQFSTAVECEAFETKPSHMQTREKPVENLQAVTCTKSTPSKDVFETPPQINAKTALPPPLTRGKRFRPFSDDEDDASTSTKRTDQTTSVQDTEDGLTALNDSYESEIATNLDDSEEVESSQPQEKSESSNRKRNSRPVECSSPLKRSKSKSMKSESKSLNTEPKSLQYFEGKPLRSSSTPSQSCSTPNAGSTEGKCQTSTGYSELKYLEAIGSIRTIRRLKHPGINKVPSTSIPDTNTPFVSPESQNGWDRKSKLKISYRLGATTDDIQYALIIYEPLTNMFRRNLMEEFQQAAANESPKASAAKTPRSKSRIKSPQIKKDKLASLRRLRF